MNDIEGGIRGLDRDRLRVVMAAMGAGDRAAVVTLFTEFGGRIAGVVRRRLRGLGIHDPEDDDVHGLVIDACFELEGCAAAWDPDGGALPWNWASRRIDARVAKWAGIFTDPLDDTVSEPAAPSLVAGATEAGAAETLDKLAAGGGQAELLAAAFREAGVSERDRAVLLEFSVQRSLGDPSPAPTIGALFGLKADNVRQIVSRTRATVAAVIEGDDRYRALRDLPFLRP